MKGPLSIIFYCSMELISTSEPAASSSLSILLLLTFSDSAQGKADLVYGYCLFVTIKHAQTWAYLQHTHTQRDEHVDRSL